MFSVPTKLKVLSKTSSFHLMWKLWENLVKYKTGGFRQNWRFWNLVKIWVFHVSPKPRGFLPNLEFSQVFLKTEIFNLKTKSWGLKWKLEVFKCSKTERLFECQNLEVFLETSSFATSQEKLRSLCVCKPRVFSWKLKFWLLLRKLGIDSVRLNLEVFPET